MVRKNPDGSVSVGILTEHIPTAVAETKAEEPVVSAPKEVKKPVRNPVKKPVKK